MRKEVLFEVLGDIDEAYVELTGCAGGICAERDGAAGGSIRAEREGIIGLGIRAEREGLTGLGIRAEREGLTGLGIRAEREGLTGRGIRAERGRNALWRKHAWKGCVAIAACIVIAAMGLHLWNVSRNWELSEASRGVSVRNVSRIPDIASAACLVWFSEEELFSYFDTVIFSGEIRSIENIVIDFNGSREYRAVAEIEVEKVYRGGLEEGGSLAVLVPCGIGGGPYATSMDTAAAMEPGMKGIFMPMVYKDTDIWQENGATLALKDIADYGFADGCRYAFLDTKAGLVFDRNAYESIQDAESLEEIEAYVLRMLGGAR